MNNTQSRPEGETAIMVVPPPDIQGYANHYRNLYMPGTMRHIEPHVTITYPFVPYHKLAESLPVLEEVLAGCAPTRFSIRGFERFPNEGILYLRLAKPERVHAIYQAILARFPEYRAYGGKYGDEFTPHMTVGEFTDREELERIYTELSVQRLYIGWDVEKVVVKYKTQDKMWHTSAELPLLGRMWPAG